MQDMIFGTLATDELKLVDHRARGRGVQHASRIEPRDPVPGKPVRLTLTIGPDLKADRSACYYTVEGSEPAGSRGKPHQGKAVEFQRVSSSWDTFLWGYISTWEAEIPPQLEGTAVRYKISAWAEGGKEVFADWPDVKLTVDRTAKYFFDGLPLPRQQPWGDPDTDRTFTYRVDRLSPPQWAREAVIYHIFVDRFDPGPDREWIQVKDLGGTFGGTLWGVAERLDYLNELGATAIWLSPIFPSPSIHRYDAVGYRRVADELGGDQALRELIDRAHQRGIRVILDLVCNHISDQHPYFQAAFRDPGSPYRDWFYFDPEEPQHPYRTFFGVPGMPQVNLDHPEAREWMLEIGRFWLEEFNVDGFRLDHANGPGPGFWSDFRAACKEIKPDCFCFGEVVETPEVQRTYVGRLDGMLDFHLCDALRRAFGYGEMELEMLQGMIRRHLSYFPPDFLMTGFLDNHDMDRFPFIAGNDREALRRAARCLFHLPGPPVIYYGTEVGLTQTISKTSEVGLEASRGAMVWGEEQDRELFAFFQELIAARQEAKPWEHPQEVSGELCD